MWVERRSMLTGEIRGMKMPVTPEQIRDWQAGGLIQKVMPQITPAQREFLKTGLYPSEFDAVAKPLDAEFYSKET